MVVKVTEAPTRPEAVFTPRGEFNPRMYTPRSTLEKDFAQKLRVASHLILFGESGCGKSWLYRSFFASNAVYFKIVNLADASRNGRIAPEILRTVIGSTPLLTGYEEKKTAQLGLPGVAAGSLDHVKKFEMPPEDPLRHAIREFRNQAGAGHAFLVFDNLERIFDKPSLMEELADIITLADDDEFLQHEVRFLIVGVPAGVKEYFNRTPSHRTIANRLVEIEEVSRLSSSETSALVNKGFIGELQYDIAAGDIDTVLKHVEWVTDRIPQAVHEYCLELAFCAETSREVSANLLNEADRKWLRGSLNAAYCCRRTAQ
jgi:AAA domain